MVAGEGDNLYARSHHEECHVKPYLVVACSCRAMGYGIGTNLVSIACYGYGLEDALGRYGDGIAVVTKHIAEYHVFQRLLVILLRHVESNVLYCTELVCVFLILLQLLLAEATCVGTGCIHIVPLLFQLHNCVRGVQTA